MAWTFTRAALEAERDRAAEAVAERPNKIANQELGHALRWLDDEAGAREAYRGGAVAMKERVLDRGRSNNAMGWTEYGNLLRNAGEEDAARAEYERALEELGDEPSVRAAELRYLLGREPGAAPDGPLWERALNALAAGERLDATRDKIVRAIRAERILPTSSGRTMSLWELLEETFRVEAERDGTPVPDHATMLERTKLLGERAPAPVLDPPPEGRWMVGDASIMRGERGPVKAVLSGRLWLELTDLGLGKWAIDLFDTEVGKVNESGPFDSFGEAVEGAKDALRSKADERAVETLDALVRAY
ncbi:hypothetical protein OM076_19400 [Solirubrobacter ginsenosidimutans]|uniref:Tetratricopeptide repeat protein n=1 Tax=Solirubrobacter ginsenosidimutans TaxID=490573 RepID=A0A9X3S675_9ACTN|nr:hypothetical protein [Solirubrobacter ginsenosidimutans]MDA0162448.1 hypothetical protein [Solirubrobacter ginsenosidimutans]